MIKLLALDVGLARIGVATGDPLGITVRPVGVIQRRSRREDFAELAGLVRAEGAEAILCGLPLNMDGSEGGQAKTTRKWAMRLAHALRLLLEKPIPIIFWDERLSTHEAQEFLDQGMRAEEDAAAAAVILRSYVDAQQRGSTLDYGRIDLPDKVSG
ncbi:MAG: Holliday junction resolvase RuvX [Caldilineaceae bacterium]|nr:Holliday junction resolvase RuvX [Caldilineaceae bacterium]MBP8109297.1 Holliday junction resolvase RuvX [Caldilineaceae bacterium]MBP8121030.1 Holliday junction resolvase RuvX [Caldilineaceae bacterium]MBP9071755.1 Holliday junction resolvase RuvX [Caldilineaceae bacterium]